MMNSLSAEVVDLMWGSSFFSLGAFVTIGCILEYTNNIFLSGLSVLLLGKMSLL
jgi:hypothetical protein